MDMIALCRRITALFLLLLIAAGHGYTASAQNGQSTSPAELIFILDASGSMWGQIEGENKITIAKKVLVDLIGELPDETNVGLIAYGHRDKGDCEDIETVVPPGPADKTLLTEKIEAINPKGKTPITGSVTRAFDILRSKESSATVILLSDGLETCGGDPCKTVREAKESGINFVMHVVGFDVSKEDVSQLECAAQAGGGLYMSAGNAGELSDALDTAVELPVDSPAGRLSVKVTADGKLRDSTVNVIDAGSGELAAGGRTYESEETNPRIMPLPDGTYDIEVIPLGIDGAKKQVIQGVVIENGGLIEKAVDFGFGELSVKVTRNGSLSDATVSVYEAGTRNSVAGGRTYTGPESNPKKISIGPGVYDVSIGSVEMTDKPSRVFENIEINAGETTERTVEFSSGVLSVGALSENGLVDATVNVKEAKTGESVAGGRTYAKPESNPKQFMLSPGAYVVTVNALKLEEKPSRSFEVEVKEGETAKIEASFTE